ncbi:MAG: hypothetical protein ACYC33_03630 [Thermoleophilia bacterium]
MHPKSQKILDDVELPPIGFLPMFYRMSWRESFVLELDEPVTVRDDARGYPLDQSIEVSPLTGTSLIRLLKIERGRLTKPEVYGSMSVDQGLPQLQARHASYFVASEGERILGAVGYRFEEHDANLRITELIAEDSTVKGSLLRFAVEQAEQVHRAEVIECDVDAACPAMQQTLFEMGFLPAAFVPGMVFHATHRPDVVKMAKLNLPWDLGPLDLTEPSREYFETVAPAFEQACEERMKKLPALETPGLAGFTSLEAYFLQRAGRESTPTPGSPLDAQAVHLVLAGAVRQGDAKIGAGR